MLEKDQYMAKKTIKPKRLKKDYIYALGRRREAVARVRLHKGRQEHLINETPIGQYFPGERVLRTWSKPFQVTNTEGKYYITVKVVGGGKNGQLEAVVLGTARALVKLDEDKNRPILKKYNLLTRDPRSKERRKVGTGGKARRKKQSPKR